MRAGMRNCQRQAAKALGVDVSTVNRDLLRNATESVAKRNTDRPKPTPARQHDLDECGAPDADAVFAKLRANKRPRRARLSGAQTGATPCRTTTNTFEGQDTMGAVLREARGCAIHRVQGKNFREAAEFWGILYT